VLVVPRLAALDWQALGAGTVTLHPAAGMDDIAPGGEGGAP
jgi:hypothetical protein